MRALQVRAHPLERGGLPSSAEHATVLLLRRGVRAAERAQGLMNVEKMPAAAGMLFVYDRERPVSFWMKNTLIPLDMIFADAEGRVVAIHENAIPHDETPIPSGAPSQYVLEINGGLASTLGIEVGSEMKHPAIEAAAWPCG